MRANVNELINRVFFGMFRVQRTPATMMPAVSGFYIAGETNIMSLALMALTVFFLHISASVLNDIADYKSDKVNYPRRLLVSGVISRRQAWVLSTMLMAVGLLLAWMLDWLFFMLVVAIGLSLEVAYNFGARLKDRAVGSVVYLSFSTATIPFLGGFVIMRNVDIVAVTFALFLAIFTTTSIVGSLKDVKGDSRADKRTITVVLGAKRAKNIMLIVIPLPILAYPLVWLIFGFQQIYLLYSAIPISIRLLMEYLVYKHKDTDNTTSTKIDAPRVLNRLLIFIDFTILALAKPEDGLPWLRR